jgi:hypothetical protein
MVSAGILTEVVDFIPDFARVIQQKILRKRALARYKKNVVLPKIRAAESFWFTEQLAKLNDDGLVPYASLAPLRRPWRPDVVWMPWGRTQWKFFVLGQWLVSRCRFLSPCGVLGARPGCCRFALAAVSQRLVSNTSSAYAPPRPSTEMSFHPMPAVPLPLGVSRVAMMSQSFAYRCASSASPWRSWRQPSRMAAAVHLTKGPESYTL